MTIREWVSELINQTEKASAPQLARLVEQVGAAPFASDLLEVDEPLWGGFWHGDVIAPGYRLPAVELALLRATRLDATWPEGTPIPEFLADLHWAIADPRAGIWMLVLAGEPCVVFASEKSVIRSQKSVASSQRSAVSGRRLVTIVWYCATTERLQAGYRTGTTALNFGRAVEQRPLYVSDEAHPEPVQTDWLWEVLEQANATGGQTLTARLDTEILRLRIQTR